MEAQDLFYSGFSDDAEMFGKVDQARAHEGSPG